MPNVHIVINEKGKFDVVLLQRGKVLSHTRQGYERKKSAFGYVRSLLKIFNWYLSTIPNVDVQDDTGERPIVYMVTYDEVKVSNRKPSKKYIPERKK